MLTGGCYCGHVRYEAGGTPFHETLCHCADCRRTVGAPVVAWFTVRLNDFHFTTGEPTRFASSSGVARSFCPACGTSLTYQSTQAGDEIDITTASLDAPEKAPPRDQVHTAAALPWMGEAPALPALPGGRSPA